MQSLEMARDKEEGEIVLCSPVAAIMLERLENKALGFMESSATPCALVSDLAEFLIRRDTLGMWLCLGLGQWWPSWSTSYPHVKQ